MNILNINPRKHFVHILQADKDFLFSLFEITKQIKKDPLQFRGRLDGKLLATLFYEPSTRTRFSFEAAMLKLGGAVITTENAAKFSSAAKGESLEDSARVVSSYVDFIVIRHWLDDAAERFAAYSNVPVINAGSGTAQHPTQALLDSFTIWEHFSRLEDLNIAFAGDLKRGRTVNSLAPLLATFKGNKFYFVSPNNSKIKDSLRDFLKKQQVEFIETDNLEEVLLHIDVLYMTRIQKERFKNEKEYLKAKGKLILTKQLVDKMRKNAIIMHPLPRVDEITPEVDKDKRAIYFKQAQNGLYVRMALLLMMSDFAARHS